MLGGVLRSTLVFVAAVPQNRNLILKDFFSTSSKVSTIPPLMDECVLNKLAGYFLIFVIFFFCSYLVCISPLASKVSLGSAKVSLLRLGEDPGSRLWSL